MPTENSVQQFVMSVEAAFNALESIAQDPAALQSFASTPVTLRDTPHFNMPVTVISRTEVSELRRQLSSAISAEKWTDGFMFAIKLITFFASFA